MEWGRTLLWVIRGSAAGLMLFLVLVVAVYALVPLESPEAERIAASRVAQAGTV
jgi:hypothetical protein